MSTREQIDDAIEGVQRALERNHEHHEADDFDECLAYPCVSWRRIKATLAGSPGSAPACPLCSIDDGLVREWVSKARAVARAKGLLGGSAPERKTTAGEEEKES